MRVDSRPGFTTVALILSSRSMFGLCSRFADGPPVLRRAARQIAAPHGKQVQGQCRDRLKPPPLRAFIEVLAGHAASHRPPLGKNCRMSWECSARVQFTQ